MIQLGCSIPGRGGGSTATRVSGRRAGVGRQPAASTEAVESNRSSWTITTDRELPCIGAPGTKGIDIATPDSAIRSLRQYRRKWHRHTPHHRTRARSPRASAAGALPGQTPEPARPKPRSELSEALGVHPMPMVTRSIPGCLAIAPCSIWRQDASAERADVQRGPFETDVLEQRHRGRTFLPPLYPHLMMRTPRWKRIPKC